MATRYKMLTIDTVLVDNTEVFVNNTEVFVKLAKIVSV